MAMSSLRTKQVVEHVRNITVVKTKLVPKYIPMKACGWKSHWILLDDFRIELFVISNDMIPERFTECSAHRIPLVTNDIIELYIIDVCHVSHYLAAIRFSPMKFTYISYTCYIPTIPLNDISTVFIFMYIYTHSIHIYVYTYNLYIYIYIHIYVCTYNIYIYI